MHTLYEHGEQIRVPDRRGLERYLCELWQSYKKLWPEKAYDQAHDSRKPYQPFLSFDGDLASANNFIGFINYEDVAIEIYPKVFRSNSNLSKEQMHRHLFYWLSYCRKIKFPFNQSYVDSFEIEQLPELVMFLMARQIHDTISEQPYLAYQNVQEALTTPRGRINFSQYTRRIAYGHFHQIDCEYEPFVFDNLLNRVIKYCSRLLLSKTRLTETQRLLNDVLFILDEVEDLPCTTSALTSIHINPMHAGYAEVVAYCRMILENQVCAHEAYEMKNWSLLIPMEYVFEDFITGFLQDHVGKDYHVEPQKSDLYLQQETRAFQLQHDILLTHKNTKEKIIVDTKYKQRGMQVAMDNKKGISQDDMYQMISYAYRRGTDKVLLIYPGATSGGLPDYTFKVKNGKSLEEIMIKAVEVPFWSEHDPNLLSSHLLNKLEEVFSEGFS